MDNQALNTFFEKLDRSLFIGGNYKPFAGQDRPLPIGYGQTISQPTLVVEMTRLLAPDKLSRVLEIGTGSGYQTAFLAEFSAKVYTIERFTEFTEAAKKRLEGLGYNNIRFKTGDGSEGWPAASPFDRIIVTAAAGTMPDVLIAQLAVNGRLLVPVGEEGMQVLKLVTKDADGVVSVSDIERVRFVEMKGRYGWRT